MLFTIGYKLLFLFFVVYPLWRANALAGSPAEEMTRIFLWTPALMLAIPWRYVFRTYVMLPKSRLA